MGVRMCEPKSLDFLTFPSPREALGQKLAQTPTPCNHAGLQPNYFKCCRDLSAEKLPLEAASTNKPVMAAAAKMATG